MAILVFAVLVEFVTALEVAVAASPADVDAKVEEFLVGCCLKDGRGAAGIEDDEGDVNEEKETAAADEDKDDIP